MPIPLPNLDDKTYAELVDEARTSIPRHYPQWTDHNPSDPGMTLVELLAWLTEMVLYRTNRIPEATRRTFLKLLDGAAPPQGQPIDTAIRATLQGLRERWRAITADDYEYLLASQWPSSPEAAALAPEARIMRRFLCAAQPLGDIDLIVLPDIGVGATPWLAPSAALAAAVRAFFDPRRTITTRVHVRGPTYVPASIHATLHLADAMVPRDVRDAHGNVIAKGVESYAREALVAYFHPWSGGAEGKGWPLGRDLAISEIYALLDPIARVDFVSNVTITLPVPSDQAARAVKEGSTTVAIRLDAYELPRIEPSSVTFDLMEKRGGQWLPIP
ncbi:hypothetical protein A7982_13057 [Minicystis rosea]|nr:hypothetical protein A7982_13057 [Minicystis rosea]